MRARGRRACVAAAHGCGGVEISPLLLPASLPVVQSFFGRSPGRDYAARAESPAQNSRQAFRPPTSMNRSYGSLSAHPFHRAPVMGESETAGGIVTPDEIESPRSGSVGGRDKEDGGWTKVLRGLCLVCCCLVVDNDRESSR